MHKRMKTRIVIPVFLVLLAAGCVSQAVYHPVGAIRHTPQDASLEFEDVSFVAKGGMTICGWWIPAMSPRGTVLFCHGNGGNISSCMDTAIFINRLGLNLLIFDYRGYGRSSGSPSEQGTYDDADAAWEYLVTVRKIPPEKVIIWGRSLGGPIAARTASVHPAGIVIMESTFISLQQLVSDRFSPALSWLLSDYAYDTRHYLEKVNAPVLVIHSPDDEVVPFAHGKAIFESIQQPKSFMEIRGDHNRGFAESRELYEKSINDFIIRHLKAEEVSAQ